MPAACSNLIENGSFEERTAWEIPSTEYTARYSSDIAHTGITSMRTGIVDPVDNRYSYSSARQLVSIPWDANLAKLRFYRFPISGEIYTSSPEDVFRLLPALPAVGDTVEEDVLSGDIQMVLILDYYDNIISTLMWGLSDRQAWQYREFDLMGYRGWTIKVYFGTYNDGWGGVSAQYFDDVSLEVCQP